MLESGYSIKMGSKCKACYSCVRACPVKAIHVRKNSVFPHIDESRCIYVWCVLSCLCLSCDFVFGLKKRGEDVC